MNAGNCKALALTGRTVVMTSREEKGASTLCGETPGAPLPLTSSDVLTSFGQKGWVQHPHFMLS